NRGRRRSRAPGPPVLPGRAVRPGPTGGAHPPAPDRPGRAAPGPAADTAPAGSSTLLGRFPRRPPAPPGPVRGTPAPGAPSAKTDTAVRPTTVALDAGPGGGAGARPPVPGPAWDRARVARVAVPAAVVAVVGAAALSLALVQSPAGHPHGGRSAGATRAARGRATTTTTSPGTGALEPSGTSAFGATYAAPAGSYTVTVDATGLCWVDATETGSGAVVWTGTLSAGQQRPLQGSGAMALQLGAASDVTVALDGRPVRLPAGFRSPFTMSFAPTPA
ncbi:MAG TPA: DUF4115 domain-containing protein, partial [Acidimicrobiales bacterium]|nr:DUF4115 domain-containing protein [Acidimicrobiales bacterium]